METRANYVAVGAFVLTCVVGLFLALLWLAGSQYRQEATYYQTYFTGGVTGLGKGTKVRYNGIDVGRVTALDFDPDDPKRVIATLAVRPDVPIYEDSVASIESEGFTGGSYVEIEGGTKAAKLLTAKDGQPYPVIPSKESSLAELFASTPQLLDRLNVISERVADLLNDQNRQAIAGLLGNLRDASAVLSRRSGDIDTIIVNLADSAKLVQATLTDLHGLLQKSGNLPDKASATLASADDAAKKLAQLSGDLDDVIKGSKGQLSEATSEGMVQLTALLAETRTLVESLTRLSNQLNRQPTGLLFGDRREGYSPK
jgi:phospholipid/cholesterol/gamma-HCH transport system substrate-binding protein